MRRMGKGIVLWREGAAIIIGIPPNGMAVAAFGPLGQQLGTVFGSLSLLFCFTSKLFLFFFL